MNKATKFKVGDIVMCEGHEAVIAHANIEGIQGKHLVEFLHSSYGWHRDEDVPPSYESVGTNTYYRVHESDLTLVKSKRGRKAKPKPVNYILNYKLDEDPTEEFETLTQVKKRIQELAKDSSLERHSVVVYKVSKRMPVTLEDNVLIKGLTK